MQRQLLNWMYVACQRQRHRHRVVRIKATHLGARSGIWASFRRALNLVSLLAGSELDAVRALLSCILIDAKRFLKRARGCERAP
jgi:hypothetical protein